MAEAYLKKHPENVVSLYSAAINRYSSKISEKDNRYSLFRISDIICDAYRKALLDNGTLFSLAEKEEKGREDIFNGLWENKKLHELEQNSFIESYVKKYPENAAELMSYILNMTHRNMAHKDALSCRKKLFKKVDMGLKKSSICGVLSRLEKNSQKPTVSSQNRGKSRI